MNDQPYPSRIEDPLLENAIWLRESQMITGIGVYILDISAGKWRCSGSFRAMFGLGNEPEYTVGDWLDLVHPDDRQMMADYFQNDVVGKCGVFDREYRIVRRNDRVARWVYGRGDLEFDDQGVPVRMHGVIQDITERKQAELALIERNRFIETIIDLTPDILYIYDLIERRNIFSNDGIRKVLGYTSEEMEEMEDQVLPLLMHPDDFARYLTEVFPKYLTARDYEPVVHQYRMKHKDGGWRWLTANEIIYSRDADGSPRQIFGRIHDFTSRKRAEDELKRSEESFRRQNGLFLSLLRNLPVGVFMVEAPSGKPLVANETALKLLGRGILPDASRENLSDVYKAYLAGTAAGYPLDRMPILRGMNGETSYIDDMEVERPDGSRILLEVFGSPVVDDQGRVWASLVSFSDITERRKSEDELQAYRRHLEQLVDHRTAELGSAVKLLQVEKKAMEKANRDLKLMQAQLVQTEKMASLGRLASGIAHEINNPVSYISTNLAVMVKYADIIDELLELYNQLESAVKANQPPEQAAAFQELARRLSLVEDFKAEVGLATMLADRRKLIEESIHGAELVARIVADLRTFVREEKVFQESADIHALIDAALNITWNSLKYHVQVAKEYEPGMPDVVCYPRLMEQVFLNLFLNAAQAMGDKGKIVIRTSRKHEVLLIEVEDNGSGILEDDLPHIFEPFFTTKEVGQGTGLGLSIVYNIIEKHGGRVTVRSQVGEGTVFTLQLPIRGNG